MADRQINALQHEIHLRPVKEVSNREKETSELCLRENSQRSQQCFACAQLVQLMQGRVEGVDQVIIGTLDDLRSSDCSWHRLPFATNGDLPRSIAKNVAVWAQSKSPFDKIRVFSYHGGLISQEFQALRPFGDPTRTEKGRVLDNRWIDTGLLRQWKQDCESQHGQVCQMPRFPIQFQPDDLFLLVDTWSKCLVSAPSECRYIALSYVWGGAKGLKTTKATLETFLQKNAFSMTDLLPEFPNTIRDAMKLVELLGERYLWVDSLCIVQDDEHTKHIQISNMAAIYNYACLTIVAANGDDANHGLRGVQASSSSQPRNLDQHIYSLFEDYPVIDRGSFAMNSTYHSRGWTFQEDLFARRKLIFTRKQVWWHCQCAAWREDVHPADRTRFEFYGGNDTLLHTYSYPNFSAFAELVNTYNQMNFTYPEDALSALSGAFSVLSRTFDGGFICGLPEMFFDIALLWQTRGPLIRRRLSRRSSNSGDNRLPTWSWAAWQGGINFGAWSDENEFDWCSIQPRQPPRTKRIVQWYCRETLESERRAINSTWDQYAYLGDDETPQSGWTRHSSDIPVLKTDYAEKWPEDPRYKYFFTHESLPEEQFWYPIILRDHNAGPVFRRHTPFLSCTTQRAYLLAVAWIESREMSISLGRSRAPTNRFAASLADGRGRWAGVVQLDDGSENGQNLVGSSLELISISEGFAYNARTSGYYFIEWSWPERPKEGLKYCFYNVLWIEWEEGVAYRKGIGRVEKDIWESLELETVEVTLG